MAQNPSPAAFREAQVAPLGLAGAIARARDELSVLTQLPLDAVASTRRLPDGGWSIVMDLIESPARMGDNDLLSTYEVELGDAGDVTRIERIARYRREDHG
jgi:hypothetical protein